MRRPRKGQIISPAFFKSYGKDIRKISEENGDSRKNPTDLYWRGHIPVVYVKTPLSTETTSTPNGVSTAMNVTRHSRAKSSQRMWLSTVRAISSIGSLKVTLKSTRKQSEIMYDRGS